MRLGWQDAEGRQHQAQVGRRALAQPPVKHIDLARPDGQVVRYLRLYHFSSPAAGSAGAGPRGTAAAVAAAVEEGERQGVAGYILDLRDNPGESARALKLFCIASVVLSTVAALQWPATSRTSGTILVRLLISLTWLLWWAKCSSPLLWCMPSSFRPPVSAWQQLDGALLSTPRAAHAACVVQAAALTPPSRRPPSFWETATSSPPL